MATPPSMATSQVQVGSGVEFHKTSKIRQFPDGWGAPKSEITGAILITLELDWKEINDRNLYKSPQIISPLQTSRDLLPGEVHDTKRPAELSLTTTGTANLQSPSGVSGGLSSNNLSPVAATPVTVTPVTASPQGSRTFLMPSQTPPLLNIDGPQIRVSSHPNSFLEKFLIYWCYCDLSIVNNFANIPVDRQKVEIMEYLDGIIKSILLLGRTAESNDDFNLQLQSLLEFHKKCNLTLNDYGRIGNALLLTLQECLPDKLQNIEKWKIAYGNLLPPILKAVDFGREAFVLQGLQRQSTRAILYTEKGQIAARAGKGSPGRHPSVLSSSPEERDRPQKDDGKKPKAGGTQSAPSSSWICWRKGQ